MKNRILRFQSTNLTQTFNIKVSHLATTKFRSTYMDLLNKKVYRKNFVKFAKKISFLLKHIWPTASEI